MLTGRTGFRVRTAMAEEVLSRAVREGVRVESARREDERTARFWIRASDEKAFRAFLERFGIFYEVTERRGFPRIRRFLSARAALIPGMLLALFLLSALSGRVWVISVSGAETEAEKIRIETLLAECGVNAGMSKGKLNPDTVSKELLAKAPEYAFFGVKPSGVYLLVNAVKADGAPEVYKKSDARDLVSSADGVVLSVNVIAGTARVKAGDTVRAGEALILGTERITPDGQTRAVRAEGSVIARVWTQDTAVFPLSRTEKRYTGRVCRVSRFVCPWFSRALSGKNTFSAFDEEISASPVGGMFLPMSVEISSFREYAPEEILLSEADAAACATARAIAGARKNAPAGASEREIWTQYEVRNGCVYARAVVEWTRELLTEPQGG